MAYEDRRQQTGILGDLKAGYAPLAALESTCFTMLGNQAGELLSGVSADLYQVAAPSLFAGERPIFRKLISSPTSIMNGILSCVSPLQTHFILDTATAGISGKGCLCYGYME
ncbi:MAG: hypothetical protein DRR42_03315 [Gammaproteobacteria bacterium]|nr:MAG: hypothetical protein DRR42_03315 [Gammaproteobacteria bacterium]